VPMSLTPMWKQMKAVAHIYDTALLSPYQTGELLPVGRFADVSVRTRLLLGGKSPGWIANAARELERVMPTGELTVLEGQTHMLKPKVTAPSRRVISPSGVVWMSAVLSATIRVIGLP
jgi:hypothetical protein